MCTQKIERGTSGVAVNSVQYGDSILRIFEAETLQEEPH